MTTTYRAITPCGAFQAAIEESEDEPEVQVAPVPTDAKKAQESEESADQDFLVLASTGDVDFYDQAVADRLEALAKKCAAPDSTYYPLVMQAKIAAKNWLTAEFKKNLTRY